MDNNANDSSVTEYRRLIRERASDTMTNLHHVLSRDPVVLPEERQHVGLEQRRPSVEHCDYSYGAAVHRLRHMLSAGADTTTAKTVIFTDDSHGIKSSAECRGPVHTRCTHTCQGPVHMSSTLALPTADELYHLLEKQTLLSQQLQSQNALLKAELDKVKWRVLEIVEENAVLHTELKRNVVDDIVHCSNKLTPSVAPPQQTPTRFDYERVHDELQRINSLHEAKTCRLEAHLQYMKEECSRHEKESAELSGKLRTMESLLSAGNGTGGLCILCAQQEGVLAAPTALSHQQTIDTLTRERDDLASQVAVLKVRLQEMSAREEDAYQQVKGSIELAEQAQLSMMQAVVEREQVREELENMRQRFDDHVNQMNQRIVNECEMARREGHGAREQLEVKVKELLCQLAEVQCTLDKTVRDRMSLVAELDVAHSQLSTVDDNYGKATDNMKVTMTQATLEHRLAVQQVARLRQEIDQLEHNRHAERLRLKSELEDVKRRLHQAEKELLAAKEECIQIHSANQSLEKQLHQMQLAKESLERNFGDNVEAAEKRAELREMQLTSFIENLQAKQARATSELEEIVLKHESLIQRLRDECRHLVNELEQVTSTYKTENRRLQTHNEQLRTKSDKLTRQCHELNNRLTQQTQLQEKMRERLSQLDGHGHRCSQQKLELLAKESLLLRDRQQLSRHVEFLQKELLTTPGNHLTHDKLLSTPDQQTTNC